MYEVHIKFEQESSGSSPTKYQMANISVHFSHKILKTQGGYLHHNSQQIVNTFNMYLMSV